MQRKNKVFLIFLLAGALILACSSVTISVNNEEQDNEETATATTQDKGGKPTDLPLIEIPTKEEKPTDTPEVIPVPQGDITLTGITPDSMSVGDIAQVVVTGSGFEEDTTLTLYGGKGPPPTINKIEFVNEQTLLVTIEVKEGGPTETRVWHLSAANPNGDTAILEDAFTVNP